MSCGKGRRSRQREYLDKRAAEENRCNAKLTDREDCEESGRHCEVQVAVEEDTNDIPPDCALTPWSGWTDCNEQCGNGTQTQTRSYVIRENKHKCSRFAKAPALEVTIPCMLQECGGDIESPSKSDYNPDPYGCTMSAWSMWSPCIVNGNNDVMMRYRHPLGRTLDLAEVQRRAMDILARTQIYEHSEMELDQDVEAEQEQEREVYDYQNQLMGSDCEELFCFGPSDPCAQQAFFETSKCNGIPHHCLKDPAIGHCRNPSNRWFFDREKNQCGLFSFSGCGGNENNFRSEEECRETCIAVQTPERSRSFEQMSLRAQRRQDATVRDCVVSAWDWGPCNATCGVGRRRKTRRIISLAQHGGRPCPRNLARYERCHLPACDNSRLDSSPWTSVTAQRGSSSHECRYSKWTNWSPPCSRRCGEYTVQTRTKFVLNPNSGQLCTNRYEEKRCNVIPCEYNN